MRLGWPGDTNQIGVRTFWGSAEQLIFGPEPPLGTEGKGGRSSGPRTKAWSMVGDGGDNGVVISALDHQRPGFARLC